MKYLVIVFAFLTTLAQAETTPTVTTQTLEKIELGESLSYPARMESNVNASIYADSDGVVTKIKKNLGEKINKGRTLLVIEHTDPIYQYAPMQMTSPVEGIVSSVKVTEGSRVSKGELLATVTDPSKVRLVVEVAAQDIRSIIPGLLGDFKISGSDKVTSARIKGISPFVDSGTGTATAQLEIVTGADNKQLLTPGLVGQVTFKVNRHNAILIPEHALVYKGKDTFVNLVENGKAKRVAVTTGPKQRGQIEILEGLKPGDVMIERSSGFVADGDTVKVDSPEAKK